MELRHLRYFLAVAEELHFARAAERLHIEQSPLSRAIRELEEELGAQLFVRTSRSTRLTLAGKLLMENAPRVLLALDQARESVKAAANGFHGRLRVALSDGITPSRLPALLARCRAAARKTRRSRSACSRCRWPSNSAACVTIYTTRASRWPTRWATASSSNPPGRMS